MAVEIARAVAYEIKVFIMLTGPRGGGMVWHAMLGAISAWQPGSGLNQQVGSWERLRRCEHMPRLGWGRNTQAKVMKGFHWCIWRTLDDSPQRTKRELVQDHPHHPGVPGLLGRPLYPEWREVRPKIGWRFKNLPDSYFFLQCRCKQSCFLNLRFGWFIVTVYKQLILYALMGFPANLVNLFIRAGFFVFVEISVYEMSSANRNNFTSFKIWMLLFYLFGLIALRRT